MMHQLLVDLIRDLSHAIYRSLNHLLRLELREISQHITWTVQAIVSRSWSTR